MTAMTNIPLVNLAAQYKQIQHEITPVVEGIMRQSEFIGGRPVVRFEQAYAEYCNAKYCIGVGNGTDALFLALKASGVGSGDEVVLPAMSFVATAEAISMTGATPVFADILPKAFTIAPQEIERCITNRTKAILPVHLYGCPADMNIINTIAKQHDLHVIQDAAQAHGAAINDAKIADFGCCCYSFYPGKNLGAYGDAGAVVANDEDFSVLVRKWANHGRTDKYNHEFPGINSRLDGIQAAVLSVKLKYLEHWTRARQALAKRYEQLLAHLPAIRCPNIPDGKNHVFHLYAIQCENRDQLRSFLVDRGIQTGIHYPIAQPFLPAYASMGHTPQDFPVSFELQNTTLSLPLFPELTEEQQTYIVNSISEWYAKQGAK